MTHLWRPVAAGCSCASGPCSTSTASSQSVVSASYISRAFTPSYRGASTNRSAFRGRQGRQRLAPALPATVITEVRTAAAGGPRSFAPINDGSDVDAELLAEAEAESLAILEWPAVCKQVACFCGTSVAAELVARGRLPRGRSREESELLLQQTAEGMAANLEVGGLYDIRPAAEAAASGTCLSGKQLEGVAATLEAAFELKGRVMVRREGSGGGGGGAALLYPTLAALAEVISDEERTLLRAIRGCIKYGSVSDEASESLAAVRAERQANKERLRSEVDTWARALQQKGAAEPNSVSLIRGRFCVGVRAGRQGELPKGSVRLGASSTGATLYVEPRPCVDLNNAEAVFTEREEQEVLRVLSMLSQLLGRRAPQLLQLVGCVTALDVVAARAKHGRWLSGVRPYFSGEPGASPFHVPGALHPVLMQRGLPPLPQPPSIDDNRFDRDFQAAPAWEMRRVLTPDGPRPGQVADGTANGGGAGGGGDVAVEPANLLPRPLDLRVPADRAVVAITGPNTGGKTVTLKAAGLMVLMAQAGLFLPCDAGALAEQRPGEGGGGGGGGPPRLAWFDRVLADIGDAQSLQQNLSTFSGHIRRIKQILAVAGGRSLVLLDEVGSGTDPLEGAALARAVLDRLAAQAHLTLATTHHAELKRASEEDARYVNVSMEFDTATLRPTYRLCWGAAGASNALDIAETLGFDRSVVLEARKVAQAMAASAAGASGGEGRESHIAGVARSLVQQLEDTRLELEEQRALRERHGRNAAKLQETLAEVREMEQELIAAPPEIVRERDGHAIRVQAELDAFASGAKLQEAVEEQLREIERLIPAEVAAYRGKGYAAGGEDDDDEAALKPGDNVYVKSRGEVGGARVVSVKGDFVTVKFDGTMLLGGRSGGRGIKLHKREVQRLKPGSAAPLFAASWSVAGFDELIGDLGRIIGETGEDERKEAAEAKARRAAARLAEQQQRLRQDMAAAEMGRASYADLYAELEQIDEDLYDDYGSEEQTAIIEMLGEEFGGSRELDSEDEEDERPRKRGQTGGGGKKQKSVPGPSPSPAAAETGQPQLSSSAGRNVGGGSGSGVGGGGSAGFAPPPPQTDANTLDLAGEIPEMATADLSDYIRDATPGSAFYVRHGMGTGAVRDAVQSLLARRSGAKGPVREWREAPGSRGEVTVVWVK